MITLPQEMPSLTFRNACSISSESEDAEDEYDEYEFRPSVSPNILFPVSTGGQRLLPPLREQNLLQLPRLDLGNDDDGIEPCGLDSLLLSAMHSPTYTFISDYSFPSRSSTSSSNSTTGVFGGMGYSRFFTSGLVSKTQKVTRQLDGVLRKLRGIVRRFKFAS